MVIVSCSVPGCEFQSGDVSEQLAIAVLSNHGLAHQPVPQTVSAPAPVGHGPKLDRPRVDVGVTTEEWNVFVRRWEVFRTGSGIDQTSAPAQLFQCAGTELGDSLLKADADVVKGSLSDLLEAMRSLAVIPVATGVLRSELLQLRQERDEPFRAFAAKARGKAETCSYVAKCTCERKVDYTDHVIRDVLLNGIHDSDIRREVIGNIAIHTMPVNDVIALVETKEMARNALPSASLSAVSSFRRQRNTPVPTPVQGPSDHAKQATCPDCHKRFNLYTEGPRGWNTKPYPRCIDCFRTRRRQPQQRLQSAASSSTAPAVLAVEADALSQVAALEINHARAAGQKRGRKKTTPGQGSINRVVLDHHIFSKGEWKRARFRDHPRAEVTISADESAKHKRQTPPDPNIRAVVSAVADTGAQSDLWSLAEYLAHGFSRDSLSRVKLGMSAANRSPIPIEGAFFAKITTRTSSGEVATCRSMIYVSSAVQSMYLSYETMLDLGLLATDFPAGGASSGDGTGHRDVTGHRPPPPSVNVTRVINGGCDTAETSGETPCSCPQRNAAPPRPSSLPFACSPDNNERMKAWLLDRYSTSTFNTCPHRPLPCMDGPPVEIHIDTHATPRTCHTAATIPLHWQQKVHEDLLRDEALGVIERVPYGEPVTWCHRMVITRKQDGSPRRTVDLSPLNKFCQRETFSVESPFHLARRVPKDTWKTVTDAWNGYHSVPLRESDRHLTTFITPFGRWRYTRAPQGFLSSGDGYNRRFDAVLSTFERKERCVDDTIHYDTDLEGHWWRTIDFLTRVGQAGIVLNPDKFQFAQRTADFAGFRVSDTAIEPLPKYLDAIRNFPTPSSTTDVRSWFGLVNQVANYAQLRDTLAPFKPFLSPRYKFVWSPKLEEAFQASKSTIIDAIRLGVEIFDVKKKTCLRPDWSCRGVGYFLLQQHCNCPSDAPDCCPSGWRITLAGSRFLTSAEQRYAAIEGEALAVAWGLEQSKYFTQGCDELIVVTDHKPLVKIFGDRTLDEITNSRLFRLKQRTLPWRFKILHLPGKTNLAADATSRNPSNSGSADGSALDMQDLVEVALMEAIRHDASDTGCLPWSLIAQEITNDTSFSGLLGMIERGHWTNDADDATVAQFRHIFDSLYVEDGVILYQDRVVVPPALRRRVMDHLHAAHQGTSSMEQRARAIVYWPGMTRDICDTRDRCADCNRNAPSQADTPPIPSPPPSTPFESVFADFFDYGGRHYLIVGDRLSGWVEVFGSTSGTDMAGASGLIRHLRCFFGTFGVSEEIATDGGPEFMADRTQDFLRTWGVRHRVSSAHFPQSNGRAEVAVKTAKRLLMSNTGPTGSLNQDRFLRAMLQLRNTPDPDCSVSPAQLVFGRPLRDAFSFVNRLEKFSNPNIRPIWRDAWAAKEEALRTRVSRTTESLTEGSRPLRPLLVGERVFIQNQQGANPNKWDRSGIVVETMDHDQYSVKVDGTGRITRRNRRFLRAFKPATLTIERRAAVSQSFPGRGHEQSDASPLPDAHPQGSLPAEQRTPVAARTPSTKAAGTPSTPPSSVARAPPASGRDIVPPTGVDDTSDPSTRRPSPTAPSPPPASRGAAPPSPHSLPDQTLTVPTRPHLPSNARASQPVTTPVASPAQPARPRPRRQARRTKVYEPETGLWIDRG